MQLIYLDLSQKGVYPVVEVKQKDVGRKIQFRLSDAGLSYSIPADSLFTVWYSGPSGEGNYSIVDTRAAFDFEPGSSFVTVELITQMLAKAGPGIMCLTITRGGKQVGLWNMHYYVEGIPGADSPEATQYYTALSHAADRAEAAAARAEEAAGLAGSNPPNVGEQTPGCYIVNATPSGNGYVLNRTALEICYNLDSDADIRLHDTETGFYHHLSWADVTNGMASVVFSGVEHDNQQNFYAVTYYVSPDNTAVKKIVQIPSSAAVLYANDLPAAINTALSQAKASGEFDGATGPKGDKGDKGADGTKGDPGYTPQKGVDYWTEADQEAMVQQILAALNQDVLGNVDAASKTINITLPPELADGVYTLKYEGTDGTVTEIGTVEVGNVDDPGNNPSMGDSGEIPLEWAVGVKLDKNTGTESSGEGYWASQHIPLTDGYTYTFSKDDGWGTAYGGANICYYDATGIGIGYELLWDAGEGTESEALTPITGAATFRVRLYAGTVNNPNNFSLTYEKTA